jgi:hypothetical protein
VGRKPARKGDFRCICVVLRHAAALALVGWYLMVPPIEPDVRKMKATSGAWVFNYDAPIGTWLLSRSFDTAAECQNRRMELWRDGEAVERLHKPPQSLTLNEAARIAGMKAQCIASNDPRLNDK